MTNHTSNQDEYSEAERTPDDVLDSAPESRGLVAEDFDVPESLLEPGDIDEDGRVITLGFCPE